VSTFLGFNDRDKANIYLLDVFVLYVWGALGISNISAFDFVSSSAYLHELLGASLPG
jgi:hypothetical protein